MLRQLLETPLIECLANASCALSMYVEHAAFFDCAVSTQRSERETSNQIGDLRVLFNPTGSTAFGFGGAIMLDPSKAGSPMFPAAWHWGGADPLDLEGGEVQPTRAAPSLSVHRSRLRRLSQ